MDFAEVLQALVEVGYRGGMAFEMIPSLVNVLGKQRHPPSFNDVALQALDHMKEVERLLAAGRLEHP